MIDKLKSLGKKIAEYESGVGLAKRIKSNLTSKEFNLKEKFLLPCIDMGNLIFRHGVFTGGELYCVLPYAIQGKYEEAIFNLVMIETLKLGTHGIFSSVRYGADKLPYISRICIRE